MAALRKAGLLQVDGYVIGYADEIYAAIAARPSGRKEK